MENKLSKKDSQELKANGMNADSENIENQATDEITGNSEKAKEQTAVSSSVSVLPNNTSNVELSGKITSERGIVKKPADGRASVAKSEVDEIGNTIPTPKNAIQNTNSGHQIRQFRSPYRKIQQQIETFVEETGAKFKPQDGFPYTFTVWSNLTPICNIYFKVVEQDKIEDIYIAETGSSPNIKYSNNIEVIKALIEILK